MTQRLSFERSVKGFPKIIPPGNHLSKKSPGKKSHFSYGRKRPPHKQYLGETQFSITYGVEVVVSIEVKVSTPPMERHDEEGNNEALRIKIDLIDEK